MYKRIIFLLTCFFVLNAIAAKTSYSNSIPEKITIYWDSSMSMKDKDIAKEIEFLDNYFNIVTDVEVELISFSNTSDIEKFFHIKNSDWSSLREALLKTKYDGVAFFDIVLEKNRSDINIVFTDGLEVIDKLNIKTKTPTYIINSSEKANHNLLKEQSYKSNVNYINLNKISIKKALTLFDMDEAEIILIDENKIKSEKTNINNNQSDEENNLVSGVVYGFEGVLNGATIIAKDKDYGTVTDEKGYFSIEATKGDVLIASYLGRNTKEVIVNESRVYDIILINSTNELDEVVVTGSLVVEEKVSLGYEKTDKSKLGYAVQSINSEDLTLARPDNLAVHGQFSGVTAYGQNEDISQMVLRANSLNLDVFPLVVINGTPIAKSVSASPFASGSIHPTATSENESPLPENYREYTIGALPHGGGRKYQLTNFVDPNNIASITILKGLAATNRWGSEGSNGVILITTKTAIFDSSKITKPYDRALVRDNNYNENLTLVNTTINKKYIDELKQQKGIIGKYNFYLEQRNNYLNDFQYFTNVSDYFYQLGYKDLSSKILSNILEINSDEIETLKFVAYKAEEKRDFNLAEIIYIKIVELKPKEAQSHRDLALIYQETGNYNKALDIYLNIKKDKFVGVNFSGLKKNINNEMRRLILRHKKNLVLTGVPKEYSNKVNYDARIVFDWNDRDADFELQFVNPQKKYFTWSHTKSKNASRIHSEKKQGFNTEEFLLIDAEKGEWLINIESNVKDKNPIVVKYTVFKNFSKPNETKETKLLILNNIKGKKMLGKIII